MCGIAGFCNRIENWESDIEKMNKRMHSRGPDDAGVWSSEDHQVVLGHKRLSIIDLSQNAAQPMTSSSGAYTIVFNGEIYNHQQIKSKLLADNFISDFRSTSDTEVLLEAFEAYGIDNTLKMLKGMYAIALYNTIQKRLYLIRDRMGEKPLYYGWVGSNNSFVFASDIACIYQLQDFYNEINRDSLKLYLEHGYIPAPYTIFHNIFKLEAGTYLVIDFPYTDCRQASYWSVMETAVSGQNVPFLGSYKDASDTLEKLLIKSINQQMVADVPVGAFLSGGTDSATVVAIMQSLSKSQVKTFTIGFSEHDFNEAEFAKAIAAHIGTEHTELYITDRDAMNMIYKLPYIFGEPFADSSQIPTYLISELTKRHVSVSLSGDAGDELFCGYNSYSHILKYWKLLQKVPYAIRRGGSCILKSPALSTLNGAYELGSLVSAKSPEHLYELLPESKKGIEHLVIGGHRPEFKYSQYPYGILSHTEDNIMLMDMLMYLPDDILVKVDRTAMAVSLETRIPLLDKDIVEFAWRLPLHYKKNKGVQKAILKDVLYRYVPKELMERPKKGFSLPLSSWLRVGMMHEWAEHMLNPDTIKRQGYLDSEAVSSLWSGFMKDGKNANNIWYILMFQMWINEFENKKL